MIAWGDLARWILWRSKLFLNETFLSSFKINPFTFTVISEDSFGTHLLCWDCLLRWNSNWQDSTRRAVWQKQDSSGSWLGALKANSWSQGGNEVARVAWSLNTAWSPASWHTVGLDFWLPGFPVGHQGLALAPTLSKAITSHMCQCVSIYFSFSFSIVSSPVTTLVVLTKLQLSDNELQVMTFFFLPTWNNMR